MGVMYSTGQIPFKYTRLNHLRENQFTSKKMMSRPMIMCSSSNHPGGGVMGAPGANAAREILRDFKRKNTTPEDFGDD